MASSARALQNTARGIGSVAGGGLRMQRRYVALQQRHPRLLASAGLLYAAAFAGWLVDRHVWPAPDIVAAFLLGFALLAGRGLSFLLDWAPFVAGLLGYVGLGGVADVSLARTHVQFPITADLAIFSGRLPTTVLQVDLWDPSRIHWYDYLSVFIYPMHFVVPLVLAFVLWTSRSDRYWRFVATYLLLCYAGLAIYALYPMAPPWWAGDLGKIPPVAPIYSLVRFGGAPFSLILATRYFHSNPVAAMPSVHAATSLLVWLVAWRLWPRWGWAVVVYPMAMAFAVIYLGQHYFVDILAGWLLALVVFFVVWGDLRGLVPEGWGLRPQKRTIGAS
jgi:membrane-associated phospholipid phosphatase